MKKQEIIEKLEELNRLLKMDPEDFAAEHNAKDPDGYQLNSERVWAYRTGYVQMGIELLIEDIRKEA